MVSNKELESVLSTLKREKALTKEQRNENVAEWVLFFRENLDIFNEMVLGINLKEMQDAMIMEMNDGNHTDIISSRGASKTFTTGVFAIDIALLYPKSEILITSETYSQANQIIDEKIDKELSGKAGLSKFLKQLRDDGYMTIKEDKKNGGKIVEIGNGSKIFSLALGEGIRSYRSTILIGDEAVRLKKKDIDGIAEPTLRPRQMACLSEYPEYMEEPKVIYLTSAKAKTSWVWTDLKKCVEGRFKRSSVKYRFFALDIYCAVAEKIQTINQLKQRQRDNDELSFQMEYLNIFLSESEDSLFNLSDFEKNQINEIPFIPRGINDIIDKEENKFPFASDDVEVRLVVNDIAMASTTDTDHDNDRTVCVCLSLNVLTGNKRVDCIYSMAGKNSDEQVIIMKRLAHEYKAHYIAFDANGIGRPFITPFNKETYDKEYDLTYLPISINTNRELSMCSEATLTDLIDLQVDTDCPQMLIPIVHDASRNHEMHIAMRKALKDETISFLKDDRDMNAIYEDKDPRFIAKSSEEKTKLLMPFIETRFMINEAISLDMQISAQGKISVKEKRLKLKDRIIAVEYANMLADKILLQYKKQEEQGDINIDDWRFLSGSFDDDNLDFDIW